MFFVSACALIIYSSCKPDASTLSDPSAKLNFSTDTLRFDTVFTQIGSATRYFKVVNTYNKPFRINNISVTTQTGVTVKLNVNGISAKKFTNIDIPSKDSIYVFVEITINPNAPLSVSPFVADEYIDFETSSGTQKVVVEAWGQNANYLPSRFSSGSLSVLSGGNPERVIALDDKKPYVIYGVLFIDSCILQIPAGAHIYVHGGLGGKATGDFYRDGIIYVLPNAHLEVNGTLANPVIFEGDRRESEFSDTPDQWAGIIIGAKSRDNVFNYTTIKNSRVGIRTDSASTTTLKNCKFFNTSGSAILATHSTLSAENCLSYNTYDKNVEIHFGGNYTFNYCTFSSVGSKNTSLYADNYYCYTQDAIGNCLNGKVFGLNLNINNSIIYGNKADELIIYNADQNKTTQFNYALKNCLIRAADTVKSVPTNFFNYCTNCIVYKTDNKLFKNIGSFDYSLDSLSVAQYKAQPINTIPKDIIDKLRDTKTPDIGCFERYPR